MKYTRQVYSCKMIAAGKSTKTSILADLFESRDFCDTALSNVS